MTPNHFVIPFKIAAAKEAVCSLRLNGRKGIQPLVTYDKVFCHEKLYRLTFKRHEVAFFIRLRCACWIFELEKANDPCFFGDKSDSVWLDEKQHGGTKQWTPWKKFDIPTTWNCKRITANCSLRFPMKNLKLKDLKVSTVHHVYGKRQTWVCTTWPKQLFRHSIFPSPWALNPKKFNKVILPLWQSGDNKD